MSFFYRSERVGKHGALFTMYKIRTLTEGADTSMFASQYTWSGRFLRKWRIDELPQLWNILKGDMALIGPRPEEARSLRHLPEDIQQKLLSVKPGLFGLSGIYFMDEEKLLQQSTDPAMDY